MNAVHDCTEFPEEGSMALQESFQWGEFDLGECLIPLKTTDDLPKTNNTLRNVTQNTNGPLPPSPAIIKKKNMARISSTMDAPGSLSVATTTSPATLSGRRSVRSSIQNQHGGSLHGRGSSPVPIGGSRVGLRLGEKSRTRSISPTAPIVRSQSPGPLGGSLHSRTSSPTALFMGGATSGHPMRRRSNSPGSLKSVSLHGTSSLRPRSRSPGALQGRNRSFRVSRRMSLKSNKGPTGLVSILRKGKFSGTATTTATTDATATTSSSSIPLSSAIPSPPGSPAMNSSSSHHRRRLLVGRRVTFWFPDEQSLACSFATEESMAFGDLGFDDSGEGLGIEDDYGLRTIRGGELPFIEVMGDYARAGTDDDEDDDYLVKRFNGSTIHEELGASFGEGNFTTSFSSFLSDESEEYQLDNEKKNDPPASQPQEQDNQKDDSQVPDRLSSCFDSSQDSFALPDFGEVDVLDKTKKSKNLKKDEKKSKNNGKRNYVNDGYDGDDNKYQESFCAYQGSFALPDFEDDCHATRKKGKNTKPNKSKVGDDSSDEGSFALPDLNEDDDIAMTEKTNLSKKSKNDVNDQDTNNDEHESAALPELNEDDDIAMTKKMNPSKKSKNNVKNKDTNDNEQASAALPDMGEGSHKLTKKNKNKEKNKDTNNDKDEGMDANRQESLDSFALPDVDEDMISHKKKSKKNKNKDAKDGDENKGVDKQELLGVRRGSFALPDTEEDGISQKKKTKKNKNKEVQDVADVDRQESLGSFALEGDMISHKKKTKKNKKKDVQTGDEDKDVDKQESLGGASRDSLDMEDDIISHKKKTKKNKNKDVQDCDEEKTGDKQESLNSVAVEDDMISHKKKTKKNKNKIVVQAVDEDKNVDKQESLDVSQGTIALPEVEEDAISHKKKKTIKNRNKIMQDVDEDKDAERQESLGMSQGSFTLADSGDDQVMRKTNKKTNQQDTENGCNVTTYNNKEIDSAVVDRQDSFSQNQDSFVSLVFAEDETLHKTNKSLNSNKDNGDDDDDDDDRQESFYASQGSFALPDNMDSSSLSSSPYHQYSNRSRIRQQHPIFCQLPRSRRRNPTPPPGLRHASRASSTGGGGGGGGGTGSSSSSSTLSSSSFSSSLRLEEAIMTPVRQKATAQGTQPIMPSSSSSSAWCCSESSLELSALRESSKASNRDSLSETSSSESPTSVTELGGLSSQMGVGVVGEDNGLNSIPGDEDDTEHRRLTVKRSMVSSLVPPIG